MKYFLLTIFVTLAYIWFGLSLLNYRLVMYALTILFSVWLSIFTAITWIDSALLIITALLLGVNVSLLVFTTQRLKGKKLKLVIGGTGLLGFVSTGCAVCGFSLLSFLGLGAGIAALPFGNTSLYLLTIAILAASAVYMVKSLRNNSCPVGGVRESDPLKTAPQAVA